MKRSRRGVDPETFPTSAVRSTAQELDTTAYDAVFIALARTLDAPLLTAERKTRPRVGRLGKLVETLAR